MSAELAAPDLRATAAWRQSSDAQGREDPNVIVSWCGRYTVVRYPDGILLAFRRFGPPEHTRWNPPEVLGRASDIVHAVDICAQHAEQEVAAR